MVGALVYTLMNPQKSFASMPVIDDAQILIHNGQQNRFIQGQNEFFADWTMSEAKRLFEQGLADNPNIDPCKSGQVETEEEIPESFDWRLLYPDCV
jgi:hypothetical protein